MATVLVVDDEPNIREVVSLYLRRDGHTVIAAWAGEEALLLYRQHRPDLVVLDLMLSKLNGIEVCRRIQAERRVPVIMLTAKGAEEDRIIGLGVGADDYVPKPFSPPELAARVAAVLRRVSERVSVSTTAPVLDFGKLRIDPNTREVVVQGTPVSLTVREFDLLMYLASHPQRVFTREQLLDSIWGYSFAVLLRAQSRGDMIQVEVADSAEGIREEHLPHIFERTFRCEKSRTRLDADHTVGAGLGLTIARALIEAHGEIINVESRVGLGTRFFFTRQRAYAA